MSFAELITLMPSWLLFCLIALESILITEIGSWFAHKRTNNAIKELEGPISTAVGAMLGLLAFMLGFTFSITASRFSERKALVIKQANAIGTCYVRTSMIPEKQKLVIRKLLKENVSNLIKLNNATPDELNKYLARNRNIQLDVWRQTASLAREDMDPELRTYFSSSVNELMEVARERKTIALIFRIPGILWTALFFLKAVSMFAIGYQTGTHGKKRILDLPLLAIAFALVITLIADMDSTGKHRLKISVFPLEDVQKLMQEDIP